MNKTLFLSFFYIAIALFSSACSLKDDLNEVINEGFPVTIVASVDESKTSNDGIHTKWASGDKINVIHIGVGHSTYYSSEFSYTSDNTFSGSLSRDYSSYNLYAVYPYTSGSKDPAKVAVTVESSQTQNGASSTSHLAGSAFPLFGKKLKAAKSSTLKINMKNGLCQTVFKVKNTLDVPITVTGIEFTSASYITGSFTVDITGDTPAWSSSEGSSKTVSLAVSGDAVIQAGQTAEFSAGIAPSTVASGESLSIKILAHRSGASDVPCTVTKTMTKEQSFVGGTKKTLNIAYKETPTADKYVKVTGAPESWEGQYLFVDETASKAFAAFSDVDDYAFGVTIVDGNTIVATDEVNKYALSVTSAGATHPCIGNNPAYDVRNTDGKYIYWSSNKGGVVLDDNNIYEKHPSNDNKDTQYGHCFEYSNNAVKVKSAGFVSSFTVYYLRYSQSAFSYNKTEGNKIQLYRLEGGSLKKSQSLSFASSAISWKIGDDKKIGSTYDFPQSVSGAKTSPVTYSSGNASVATIVNGKIKIVGLGSTIITASAPADETYYAGSASYTLSIADESTQNIENDKVKEYLDYMELHPYSTSDYSYTYVTDYYKGTGKSNRLDWPKPVSVSWTGSNASKITIYNDSSMSDVEWTQTVSGNSASVYNLVPGQKFYYKVTNSSGGEVSRGEFTTSGRRRLMRVGSSYNQNNANNCRDFGGQVTTSGKTIKYKKIYRGSNMDNTTSDEKTMLTDYMKIGLDVDLRGASKSKLSGVGISGQSYNSFSDLSNTSRMKATLGDIFDAVLDDKVAVYIHCQIGADRTGYVCLLLEAMLGVPQERCDIDFELTSFAGAVDVKTRNADTWYYSKSGTGIDFIKKQTGSSFQEKAVNYIVNTLGFKKERVQAFQDAMLN